MQPLDTRLQVAAVVLSEELNFSRAAERLAITQPALSKQIAELENRVGVTIFERTIAMSNSPKRDMCLYVVAKTR